MFKRGGITHPKNLQILQVTKQMSDIIPAQQVMGRFAIRTIDDLARLSNMLAKSGFFSDTKEAAQCGVKVLAGLELGFPAVASMTGIHIINGKPSIGANLMAAAIKRSGKYNYRITRHDNDGCTIVFYENGEVVGESTFTREDAVIAGALDGKNAHTWKKFPRNMLFSRAMSNGFRWHCPDLFTGAVVYTPDELDATTDEEGNLANEKRSPVSTQAAVVEPTTETASQVSHPNGNGNYNNERVRQVRQLMDVDGKTVLEWLKTEKLVNSPAELDSPQVDEVIQWIGVCWAEKQGVQYTHATNSFKKHVPTMIAQGYEELEAIKQWMQHVQQQQLEQEPKAIDRKELDRVAG